MLTNLYNYDYKIWLSYIKTNNEIGDTYNQFYYFRIT